MNFNQARTYIVLGVSLLIFLLFVMKARQQPSHCQPILNIKTNLRKSQNHHNRTYPFTNYRTGPDHSVLKYKIGLITDMDKKSKNREGKDAFWASILRTGHLIYSINKKKVDVRWDNRNKVLKSKLNSGGRGMELSELVVFDGNVLAVDDRTGVVYRINTSLGQAYPWVILNDGDGLKTKALKCEWATVKDQELYVGGGGKEWTTSKGEFVNADPMWVKVIQPSGGVRNIDWAFAYKALRKEVGIEFPGYLWHEAINWSSIHKKWFVLPRRESKLAYDEVADEERGTNLLLKASEDFSNVEVLKIGKVKATHGFSSFKFLPGTQDRVIVALKTVEFKELTETYIMVFTIDGEILMDELKIDHVKYEGIEFL